MPGIAVLLTSSIFGKSGMRSVMVLRINASWANAPGADTSRETASIAEHMSQPANERQEPPERRDCVFISIDPSGFERASSQPAFQGREVVYQSQTAVAKFPDRGSLARKKSQQTVCNLTHGPGRRKACA